MIGWDVLPHWICFSFLANNESCTYWVGTFFTLDLPHLVGIYDAVKWSLDNAGRVIPVVDLSCMHLTGGVCYGMATKGCACEQSFQRDRD
jgi:hypothetical protein